MERRRNGFSEVEIGYSEENAVQEAKVCLCCDVLKCSEFCIGKVFNNGLNKVVNYLARGGEIASPFEILVEMPIDLGSNEAQLEAMLILSKKTCC